MIITTKQALLGLAALGIGWILAGEPTSIDELRNGIDRLMGRHGGSGTGGGYGYGPGGVPLIPGGLPSLNFDHPHHHDHGGGMMPGMMGGPGGGGSDPNTQSQLQQMQQQMMQQQQQSQMQQQQQQFQDQLAQQNQQAQMSQMQQQLQQAQQAAAAAAGGGVAAQTAATQQQPVQQPQQPASNVPPSQQMTPSATAPGIVPQTQDQSMLGMAGMDPSQMQMQQQMQQMQNPYAQQSPYGGMMGGMGMGMPGQSPYAPSPYAPAMGTVGGYYGGGVGVPVGYGQPLFGTPMQNMFASSPNVLGNYQNVNVRPYGGVTNVSHPITGMTTYNHYGGGGSSSGGSWGGHYRSHLGIVDGDQEPHHRKPFFNHEHEVINMDLGNIYPGLDGVKVIDLIMSSPSKNADEIFPRGLNKYDYGGFEQDIHVYITRILEHMEGFNPQEKVGILKDVLQTYTQAHPFDAKFYPADPFTMNPLSHIPSKGAIIRSGLPLANEGMVYKTDGGYMLPDKYAALQMPNTNSMPPMIHHRRGSPANKKTLFFNGQ